MKIIRRNKFKNDEGFSYIDVMIAIVIMLVGILALASALTANLIRSYGTDKRIIAKQMALSTIESIISARDISRPGTIDGWDSINNVEPGKKGIFLKAYNPIREEQGWDGVAGTIDDACVETGPCIVSGRPTNNSPVIKGYQRKIVIKDVQDDERPSPPNPITRRRIEVTVRYDNNGVFIEELLSTLITNY